jgi:hypothetical protein
MSSRYDGLLVLDRAFSVGAESVPAAAFAAGMADVRFTLGAFDDQQQLG